MFQAILKFFRKLFGYKNVETVPATPEAPEPSSSTPVHDDSSGVSDFGELLVGRIRAANDNERQMVVGGFILARDVIYSKEFKEEVLKFKFNKNLTRGLTNLQIYDLYTKTKMTVDIQMFTGSFSENRIWKTEAYERNSEGFISLNRHFLFTSKAVGSAILHELGHNPFNFTHPNLEQDSVSYGLNKIFNIVIEQLGLDD